MDKHSSLISYLVGIVMMWFSRHTLQDIAFMVGAAVAVATLFINIATFFVNWHYRRKTYELHRQAAEGVTSGPDR